MAAIDRSLLACPLDPDDFRRTNIGRSKNENVFTPFQSSNLSTSPQNIHPGYLAHMGFFKKRNLSNGYRNSSVQIERLIRYLVFSGAIQFLTIESKPRILWYSTRATYLALRFFYQQLTLSANFAHRDHQRR